MTARAGSPVEARNWAIAGSVALAAHGVVAALVLSFVRTAEPPVEEPVILVELPPQAAAAPAMTTPQAVETPPADDTPPRIATPPIEVPPVRAPLPSAPVTLPPPQPARQAAAAPPPVAAAPVVTAPMGRGAGTNPTPANDPAARRAEADYFSLISAHLNRRKTYPPEAKKARQQGVVTVRFTVDRNGGVTSLSIKRGSGHEILDRATLDLVQRVAPLPRMPASMQRDSVTLSLPIDYSLRTN